jgi:hypothetical protein
MDENLETAEITDRPHEFVAGAGSFSDDTTPCAVSHEMIPYTATQHLNHHEELPPVPRGRLLLLEYARSGPGTSESFADCLTESIRTDQQLVADAASGDSNKQFRRQAVHPGTK